MLRALISVFISDHYCFTALLFLFLLEAMNQPPIRSTLASRLSEKLQASNNTKEQSDDDFKPDRKRIRVPTEDFKVQVNLM